MAVNLGYYCGGKFRGDYIIVTPTRVKFIDEVKIGGVHLLSIVPISD